MAKHIGIVACSYEGAALCYKTICNEGAYFMGEHAHPEISMHTHPLDKYMQFIENDNWTGVAELMSSSAKNLTSIGAELLICPNNTIHKVFSTAKNDVTVDWLYIGEEVAKEAERNNYSNIGIL